MINRATKWQTPPNISYLPTNKGCSLSSLAGISAEDAALIPKGLILTSWIIESVDGWENISGATLTLLSSKKHDLVYK